MNEHAYVPQEYFVCTPCSGRSTFYVLNAVSLGVCSYIAAW